MKVIDRVARTVIRVGGIGTIAAISTVFVFLFWVVWPLLRSESLAAPREIPAALGSEKVLATGPDDGLSTIWAWTDASRFVTLAAADGSVLAEQRPFEQVPTAFAFPLRAAQAIFGFADGSVRLVAMNATTEYRDDEQMPAGLRAHQAGERFLFEGKVAERVGVDQFALRGFAFQAGEPIPLTGGAAIRAVDLSLTSNGPAFASVDERGVLRVTRLTTTENFMTGENEIATESGELALVAVATRGLPRWVALRGLGDNALAVWDDGHAVRVDVRELDHPKVAEEIDLLASGDARISTLEFLNGKNTLLVGDTAGGLHAWFRVPAPSMATGDGAHFIRAHNLTTGTSAVTSLASSPRTRLLAAGYADGTVRILHVTSDRIVAESHASAGRAVTALALVPDDSAVVAWDGQLATFALDAPHPEVSLHSLLRPVLYEGYPKPEHVWQSSSGTDDFEPKFGLWPLVFGTLKATFYSMLFGVPIALMAAIYTSEFLRPEVKAVVKPAIEMMASLPSVVLGFLAALVLAPMVERSLTEVLVAVPLIPLSLLVAAQLWQLVPVARRARLQDYRFALAGVAILAGVAAAVFVGPGVERLLFGGDIHQWLDQHDDSALVGTYVQRNALVVGFVMAFAIIPIIYTIAEDALSSIPENLRAGSLALGATPWQTAVRIVVPTAMSGLFSAIMIGLGRAVGETMIVLMAAGNTPVLDWNIFNGFRTLSANIAVELPEAVRGGTHYRTLFLAAFTLFLMTFVLNTAAELVRLRFRERARQL